MSSFKSVPFFKQLIIFFFLRLKKGKILKKSILNKTLTIVAVILPLAMSQVVTLFGPELHKCALSLHLRFYLSLFFLKYMGGSIAALQAIQSS